MDDIAKKTLKRRFCKRRTLDSKRELTTAELLEHENSCRFAVKEKHVRSSVRRKQHTTKSQPSSLGAKSSTLLSTTPNVSNVSRNVFPISERRQMALIKQLTKGEVSNTGKSLFDHSSYSKSVPSTEVAVPRRLTKVNEKGETRLHVAARLNKFENLIKMIADGADINAKDYAEVIQVVIDDFYKTSGWTPLHEACSRSSVTAAYHLLAAGAQVNALGPDDETPLHDAARSGDSSLVALLLQKGANTERRNRLNQTPLEVAANAEVYQTIYNKMICTRNMMTVRGRVYPVNWCSLQSSKLVISDGGLDEDIGTAVGQLNTYSEKKITSRGKEKAISNKRLKKTFKRRRTSSCNRISNTIKDSNCTFEGSLSGQTSGCKTVFAASVSQHVASKPFNVQRTDNHQVLNQMWQNSGNELSSDVGCSQNDVSSLLPSFVCPSSGTKNIWLKAAIEAKNVSLASSLVTMVPTWPEVTQNVVTGSFNSSSGSSSSAPRNVRQITDSPPNVCKPARSLFQSFAIDHLGAHSLASFEQKAELCDVLAPPVAMFNSNCLCLPDLSSVLASQFPSAGSICAQQLAAGNTLVPTWLLSANGNGAPQLATPCVQLVFADTNTTCTQHPGMCNTPAPWFPSLNSGCAQQLATCSTLVSNSSLLNHNTCVETNVTNCGHIPRFSVRSPAASAATVIATEAAPAAAPSTTSSVLLNANPITVRSHLTCRLVPLIPVSAAIPVASDSLPLSSAAFTGTELSARQPATMSIASTREVSSYQSHRANEQNILVMTNSVNISPSVTSIKSSGAYSVDCGLGRQKARKCVYVTSPEPRVDSNSTIASLSKPCSNNKRSKKRLCTKESTPRLECVTQKMLHSNASTPQSIFPDLPEDALSSCRVPPIRLVKVDDNREEKIWSTMSSSQADEIVKSSVVMRNRDVFCSSSESAITDVKWLRRNGFQPSCKLDVDRREEVTLKMNEIADSSTFSAQPNSKDKSFKVARKRRDNATWWGTGRRVTRAFYRTQIVHDQLDMQRKRSGSFTQNDKCCEWLKLTDKQCDQLKRNVYPTSSDSTNKRQKSCLESPVASCADHINESQHVSYPMNVDHYVLATKDYALHGVISSLDHYIQGKVKPPAHLPLPLKNLYVAQESERRLLRLNHIRQDNQLMVTIECEVLREYTHMVNNGEHHTSFCAALWQQRELEIKMADNDLTQRHGKDEESTARELHRLHVKFTKIKADQVSRWRHESDCLHVMQTYEWKCKLHELGLSNASEVSSITCASSCVTPVIVVSRPIDHKFFDQQGERSLIGTEDTRASE